GAGIARRAADSGGSDDGWVLARPAEQIPLVEVFDAAPSCQPPEGADGALALQTVESLHQCQRTQLQGRALASLLPDQEPRLGEGEASAAAPPEAPPPA